MRKFSLSPAVYDDIWTLWEYLAREAGIAIADQVEVELFENFTALAERPGIGHKRPDLTIKQVFFLGVSPYLVVYRKTEPLQILAVLHGKRDVKALLKGRL